MSRRDPRIRLEQVLESIVAIERYKGEAGEREFADFPMLRDAVERRLEIIGEAVSVLRRDWPDILLAEPELPWADIAGLRVVLAHAYDKVKVVRLWETVVQDLPPLKEAVRRLLART